MKLFKYEGYEITISEEALLLKPFSDIWKRDKSKTKQTAKSELGYIYFYTDPRSDYQYIIDDDERTEAIREGEGLKATWKPDKLVMDAVTFYQRFKPTSAVLLDTTRFLVDKLMKQMKGLDLDERDEKGKPIFALNMVISSIEKVPGLALKLDEAEKVIASEIKTDNKMRGQGEKSIFEDDLNM